MTRHADVRGALLATYRVDTSLKAFSRVAPPTIAMILFAWLFPDEFAKHWGKAAAAAIAYMLVIPILYVWTYHTLPRKAVTIGLSPLYTPEGRRQFRSEQRAKADEIARLSSQSARLATEMAKLDITTDDGQRKFKQLADEKRPIDQSLAELEKIPKLRLGYMPGD